MNSEIKTLSFADFQRMLRENEGKPVYSKSENSFILEWTIGGFTYHTEVLFKQIHNSYKNIFGKENDKASIEKFHELYLKDAYEDLGNKKTSEEINLFENIQVVREQEEKPENKWKYISITNLKNTIKKSHWLTNDEKGGYTIKALNKQSAVVTLGKLKKIDGRLFSQDSLPSKK